MEKVTKHLLSTSTSFPFKNHEILVGCGCFSNFSLNLSTISSDTIFSQLPPKMMTLQTFPPAVHRVLKILVLNLLSSLDKRGVINVLLTISSEPFICFYLFFNIFTFHGFGIFFFHTIPFFTCFS